MEHYVCISTVDYLPSHSNRKAHLHTSTLALHAAISALVMIASNTLLLSRHRDCSGSILVKLIEKTLEVRRYIYSMICKLHIRPVYPDGIVCLGRALGGIEW